MKQVADGSNNNHIGQSEEEKKTKFVDTPCFTIDLETEPEKRWVPIVKMYKKQLKNLVPDIEKIESEEIGGISTLFTSVTGAFSQYLVSKDIINEMKGIAKVTKDIGLDYNRILLLNVGYNYLAYCTSMAAESNQNDLKDVGSSSQSENSQKNGPIHMRNMDWDMQSLRDLTIDVIFERKGVKIFRITTWVGFVGVMTGMRYNNFNELDKCFETSSNGNSQTSNDNGERIYQGYSLSLNYRKMGQSFGLFSNLHAAVKSYWAVEFLIRYCLENCSTYDQAIQIVTKEETMSPFYLVLCGVKKGQACLITRNRTGDEQRVLLSGEKSNLHGESIPCRFICQTNVDHWKSKIDKTWAGNDSLLLNSLERRDVASKSLCTMIDWSKQDSHLEKFQKELVHQALNVLSTIPVLNKETIYQVIMRPSINMYHSRIVYNPPNTYFK